MARKMFGEEDEADYVEHRVWRLYFDGPHDKWTMDYSGPLSAALAHAEKFFEESALYMAELVEARSGGIGPEKGAKRA